MPQTMKAVIMPAHGGHDALKYDDIEKPLPGNGEVLIKVAFTGVNHVDLVNRKIAWNFQTGGNVRSSPALLDKMVIFGSDDSKIYALDPASGTKTWEFETDGPVNGSPIVVDGIVYVGSQNGTFYALE